MQPRARCQSAHGLVQGIVNLLNHRYVYYSAFSVREGVDLDGLERKLAEKYETEISRWERTRRRQLGGGSVRLLRYQDFFILMATPGAGRFFDEEDWADSRRRAVHVEGYVVSYRRSSVTGRFHPSVAIERREYLRLKAHFIDLAAHRRVENLQAEFQRCFWEPYARIRRQYLNILRAVNRRRKTAGFDPLPSSALRLRRRCLKVYAADSRRAAVNESRP